MAILLAGCATKPAGRPLPAREHRVRAKLTQSELQSHAKATAVDMVLVKPGTENACWGGGSIIHENGYILTCFHLSYGDTSSYDSLLYFDGATEARHDLLWTAQNFDLAIHKVRGIV